jgi:photosystem II stability/assembly factor-like uncharacterized protein
MFICLFFGFLFSNSLAFGETWRQLSEGLFGGTIQTIACSPMNSDLIFIGTKGGGAFKSENGGGEWAPLGQDTLGLFVEDIAIDPNVNSIVYAGTWQGMFKSTDEGKTWFKINNGISGKDIMCIDIEKEGSQNIYIGTRLNGIFKTEDGGNIWSSISNGLDNLNIKSIKINPLNSDLVYAGTAKGLMKSQNKGQAWESVGEPLSDIVVKSISISGNNLYVGTSGEGVFKSSDLGDSWILKDSGLSPIGKMVNVVLASPLSKNVVFAGTEDGLYKTIDGGNNWIQSESSNMADFGVFTIEFNYFSSSFFLSNKSGRLYISNDMGETWNFSEIGITNLYINCIAVHPKKPHILYLGTKKRGVFKSIDGGLNWISKNDGIENMEVSSLAVDHSNPSIVYAGTMGGIYKSYDSGNIWFKSNSGIKNFFINTIEIDPSNPNVLYAGCLLHGIHKTLNGGTTWEFIEDEFLKDSVLSAEVDPTDPNVIYIGTYNGIRKSYDGGKNWQSLEKGIGEIGVSSVLIHPKNPDVIYAGTFTGGIFKTVNGGYDWFPINKGMSNINNYSLAFDRENPDFIFAGNGNGIIFITENGGETWTPLGDPGGMEGKVLSLAAVDNRIFAGTSGQGLWGFSVESKNWSALIVAGKGPTDLENEVYNQIWEETRFCANYAYTALSYRGVGDDDIFYMSHHIEPPRSSFYNDEELVQIVDATTVTKEILLDALLSFSSDGDNPAQNLIVYLMDHGLNGRFTLGPNEYLWADEFGDMLDQVNVPGHIIVILESCYSGSFIPKLISSQHPNRIIISSSSDKEKAVVDKFGRLSFSFQFWANIFGGFNLRDAFHRASDIMGPFQTPKLDGNDDDYANTETDEAIAYGITIGYPEQRKFAWDSPEIERVDITPLENGKFLLKAFVIDDVDEVWSTILPPIEIKGDASTSEPLNFPEIFLLDPDGDDWYEGIYTPQDGCGLYRFNFYASITENGENEIFSSPFPKSLMIHDATVPGDLNDDCKASLEDAILALQVVAGMNPPTVIPMESGVDIGDDERIGLEEALFAIQKSAGF